MSDEAVGEFEVVEHAGKEEAPAGGDEDGPPEEEGDAPAAGVGMPNEGAVVGGCEGEPEEEAAEGDVLGGAVVADVGAAKAEAKEGFGDEDDPGEADGPGGYGFARGEAEGQEQKDSDDDEGRFELARAGGTSGVRVDGRVEVGVRSDVEKNGNGEKEDEADDSCRSGEGAGPDCVGDGSTVEKGVGEECPKGDERKWEEDAVVTGPVEKELAAGVAGDEGDGGDGKRCGPEPERWTAPSGDGWAVGSVGFEEEGDEREATPAIELEIDVDGHPAAVSERLEEDVELRSDEKKSDEYADGVGEDEPSNRVPSGVEEDARCGQGQRY
jgi:hypothetical protein